MELKYLILECRGTESPVIFPNWIEHHEMAKGKKVLSAGFCRIKRGVEDNWKVTCWGKSQSLKVESQDEDHILIEHLLHRQ